MLKKFNLNRYAVISSLVLIATGCAVGPNYQRPTTPEVTTFKEAEGWLPAAPADALERGPWWQLFGDPVLDELAARVDVSNQNVAAAVAAYAQARALVNQQSAALFPSASLNGGETRAAKVGGNYQFSVGGAWAPDVWGRLGRVVDGGTASAAASAADLASAKLSAQGSLAVNYLSVRQQDAQLSLLATTIAGYARALEITQNRYTVGVTGKTDLLQAQTQLANAQAQEAGLQRQRAQFEHAIAVLVGQVPGNFNLTRVANWTPVVPEIPVGVPSTLLQRRPDIAAAERRVAAANEQIGIARSAYYPSVSLNASTGTGASRVADLFMASSSVWSFGLSAAQVLFDAGATSARVDGAQAAHAQSVALYRQAVLSAFKDVEDQLAATRVLLTQQQLSRVASEAADQVEQQLLNRYRSGLVSYTEVITAQTTALNARIALGQVLSNRQTTAVALIQSLGGGWYVGP